MATGPTYDLAALVGAPFETRWDVDELCLFASHLTSAGARYRLLDRITLTKPVTAKGWDAPLAVTG